MKRIKRAYRPKPQLNPEIGQQGEQLKVAAHADPAEREAEKAASAIVDSQPQLNKPVEAPAKSPTTPQVQREATNEKEEVQLKREGNHVKDVPRWVASGINKGRGEGKPLSSPTRNIMESHLSSDLSEVRVHDDAEADMLSERLGAKAFTVGQDVWFRKGKFNPETTEGKGLLAHELTHTVQQGKGDNGLIQRAPGQPFTPKREDVEYRNYDRPWEEVDRMRAGDMARELEAMGQLTRLVPRRLNQAGPFSYELIFWLAELYSEVTAQHTPEGGQKFLDALESSSTLVSQIRFLDQYYARPDTPDITFSFGGGSRFVPAGNPNQAWPSHHVNVTTEYDVLQFSFLPDHNSEDNLLHNIETMAHEITHAFRHANRMDTVTGGTISHFLDEEAQTRMAEKVVLGEMGSNTRLDSGLREKAAARAAAKPDTVSRADVALSIQSGEGITYLENFHIGRAMKALTTVDSGLSVRDRLAVQGLDRLPPKHDVATGDTAGGEAAIREVIFNQTQSATVLEPMKQAWLEEQTELQRSDPSHTFDVNDPSHQWNQLAGKPLGDAASRILLTATNRQMTLSEIKAVDINSWSPAEQALGAYVLQLELLLLKKTMAENWERNSGLVGDERKAFGNEMAATFLGISNPYDSL